MNPISTFEPTAGAHSMTRSTTSGMTLTAEDVEHPDARVDVVVSNQTDEDGQLTSYTVLITETATVPLKEIAN